MKVSRLQIIGWSLALGGLLSLQPLLGQHLLAEQFTEFPGNFIATIASFVLMGTGLSLVFWRLRIRFLGITGKETGIRLLLVSLPFIVLAIAELALNSHELLNKRADTDDRLARNLMKAN